jgi:hypothetical protein
VKKLHRAAGLLCMAAVMTLAAPPENAVAAKALDLTKMSSTLVYAQIFRMMTEPEEYEGKTVILAGMLALSDPDETGAQLYGCVVADATQCCFLGLEFEPAEPRTLKDLPDGTSITVTGVFHGMEDTDGTRCVLTDAHVEPARKRAR